MADLEMANSRSLIQKLCLVTGGGTGIGRAICHVLAREGASVAVAGNELAYVEETVTSLKEVAAQNGFSNSQFHGYELDVTQMPQVTSLVESLPKDLPSSCPPLSVVVNNAGIIRDALMLKMTEEDFDDVIQVNLKGPFLVTKATAKHMVENKVENCSIINISSISAKNGNIGQTNYAAAKGGLMSMTLTWARELGRYGIRCNAVLPGFIETSMTAGIPAHIRETVSKRISLGRLGKPEEVAEVCAFLASGKSSYITGSLIEITGGIF